MRRILVDSCQEIIKLIGDDHKHFSTVKRATVGDVAQATCGDGFVYTYEVTAISKTETTLKMLDRTKDESEAKIDVTLFMPVLKGDKNDLIVQKVTELGVKKIVPFVSTFSQAKNVRKERLDKIAREAVMQCGRSAVPEITELYELKNLSQQLKSQDCLIFPYEKAKDNELKTFLTKNRPSACGIIIGSEGGFSDEEAKILSEITQPVSLGKRILRAETACIAVVSAVMYELGGWSV
ncbi:MAG: 16S rRNA (uracil(1498)-N(3))-methyltransferase [Clostridia bacterium]|nr:16S rRNA (uracil(1498)-N(3))-methyltransferase [Clostridia bacterium]